LYPGHRVACGEPEWFTACHQSVWAGRDRCPLAMENPGPESDEPEGVPGPEGWASRAWHGVAGMASAGRGRGAITIEPSGRPRVAPRGSRSTCAR
jgi:hypothetical protein